MPRLHGKTASVRRCPAILVSYATRIAVYDDMLSTPRVIVITPKDVRTYLEEITNTVYRCMKEQGGTISLMVIREIVENFIHAQFRGAHHLDPGYTDRNHSLCRPGPRTSPDKERAFEFGVTSAASESKKRYHQRHGGTGFPMVQQYLENARRSDIDRRQPEEGNRDNRERRPHPRRRDRSGLQPTRSGRTQRARRHIGARCLRADEPAALRHGGSPKSHSRTEQPAGQRRSSQYMPAAVHGAGRIRSDPTRPKAPAPAAARRQAARRRIRPPAQAITARCSPRSQRLQRGRREQSPDSPCPCVNRTSTGLTQQQGRQNPYPATPDRHRQERRRRHPARAKQQDHPRSRHRSQYRGRYAIPGTRHATPTARLMHSATPTRRDMHHPANGAYSRMGMAGVCPSRRTIPANPLAVSVNMAPTACKRSAPTTAHAVRINERGHARVCNTSSNMTRCAAPPTLERLPSAHSGAHLVARARNAHGRGTGDKARAEADAHRHGAHMASEPAIPTGLAGGKT